MTSLPATGMATSPDLKNAEARVPLYILIKNRKILKRLQSFTKSPTLVNFTVRSGSYFGKNRTYIENHGVAEHDIGLRLVDILDSYHIALTDTVVLSDEQMNDMAVLSIIG